MSADHAPARELFDLAVQTTAVKGWSIADLASKSGVARSTIYGWRDNPGKPQAKSVNAVADALGIPRERALRAAGIIPGAAPQPAISERLRQEIMTEPGLSDSERQAVITAVEATLTRERGGPVDRAAGSGAGPQTGPGREQPAS